MRQENRHPAMAMQLALQVKSRYKSEIARDFGMSLQTLRKWLKPYAKELEKYGVTKTTKLLPPVAVKLVYKLMGYDLYDDSDKIE